MFPFFDKSDFAGVPSQRSKRPIKEFEAAIDRAIGELVRADGACGVDLWSALANVRWHASNGAVVSYSFREAATLVAWVREEGDYILWYAVDLRAWWRHGSVKQWPLKAGVGPLPTDRALR